MSDLSVFEGDIFTYMVGTAKKRFMVHKKAIEAHSLVLATMMNNGALRESVTGIAELTETNPEVFGLFAQYVYSGMYHIPSVQVPQPRIVCNSCTCKESVDGTWSKPTDFCLRCFLKDAQVDGIEKDGTSLELVYFPPGDKKNKKKNSEFPAWTPHGGRRYIPPSLRRAGCVLPTNQTSFKALEYPALGLSHIDLEEYLTTLRPKDSVTTQVCKHAQLYIFAQKYMVDSLADLCLHKLHRDLMALPIDESTIDDIAELLAYSYDNSSSPDQPAVDGEEGTTSGTGEKLRTLVMTYAVCNAKKLLGFDAFQAALRDGGEIVSDFTKGIGKRLTE